MSGFLATVDGSPYGFGTAGVTSWPTVVMNDSTPSDWPHQGGVTSPVTIVPDCLCWPNVEWTERAQVLDGDLAVDSLSFSFLDKVVTSGPAANNLLMTWLGTVLSSNIPTTTLAANIRATTGATTTTGVQALPTGTINIASNATLPTSGTVVIITSAGPQAVSFTGTTGTTLTGCTGGAGNTSNGGAVTEAIVVSSAAIFGAAPFTIWVDQEAIYINAAAGTALAPGAQGRGALGTLAVQHAIDTANAQPVFVYSRFPGFSGRRLILWWIDDNNAAWPWWRGYVNRGPRFVEVSGVTEGSGAAYQLQCEAAWNIESQRTASIPSVAIHFRGYDVNAIGIQWAAWGGTGLLWTSWSATPGQDTDFKVDIPSMMAKIVGNLWASANSEAGSPGGIGSGVTNSAVGYGTLQWFVDASGVSLTATAVTNRSPINGGPVEILYRLPSGFTGENWINIQVDAKSSQQSDPRTLTVTLPIYGSYFLYAKLGVPYRYPIDNTAFLPSAPWVDSSNTYNGFTTVVHPCLQGNYSEHAKLVLENVPTTLTDAMGNSFPGISANPPIICAIANYVPIDQDAPPVDSSGFAGNQGLLLNQDFDMFMCGRVTSPHWVLALLDGIIADPGYNLRTGSDPRNFDRSQLPRLLNVTQNSHTQRTYYLDGTKTVGEIWRDNNKYNGCSLGMVNSRISPFVLGPPTPADVSVLTIAVTDQIEPPEWEPLDDGIANSAKLSTQGISVTINDRGSIGRYGLQRQVQLDLDGSDNVNNTALQNLIQAYSTVLDRLLALWGYPGFKAKFYIGLQYHSSVFVGNFVTITDWLSPDGKGGRGFVSRRGQVIGRTKSLKEGENGGYICLEVCFYDFPQLAGYAPAVRVASVSGAVVTVATNYIAAASCTDYAGSTLTGYPGTSGDGGTSTMAQNYVVRFRSIGNTTTSTWGPYTVQSVNPGAKTITMTGSISAAVQAYITGGGTVDLEFEDFGNGSVVTAAQEQYAYVGSYTGNVIGTSTTTPQTFYP